ncbi:MAG TPA: hypothetical protein VFZ61_32700, partial [Polyangiales bacterium]
MLRLCAFERTLFHAVALGLWAPQVALAQLPSQLSIDWDGPASCPKSERFEAELTQRLDPELELLEPQQIRVRVEALEEERYLLTLTTQGATGAARRSVDLDDCGEVQRAAAVLIATSLSPGEAPAEPQAAAPRDPQAWSLRIAGLFDVSALPGPSGGPSFGLGHERGAWRLWFDARYLVGRESDQPEPARVRVDLFAVGVGAAYLWRFGALGLGPQLELELGALRGRAVVDGEGSAAAPWITAMGGGVLEADLGPVALALALALGVPALRPEFEAQDEDDVYATRPVTGRA